MNRPNRLIQETSPYLLQHAHNPVDWFPWGEEAFDQAAAENKPVFLSIGYSTCHWCHVMEAESFEDAEVAEALNKDFICVKVDREERPDIDSVYMAVCQTLTGSGGWPLTVFLTPDRKPFLAGTYFPKENRYGRRGLMELLPLIANAWRTDPESLTASGDRIIGALAGEAQVEPYSLSRAAAEKAAAGFEARYDERWGGFGRAPKFPAPHNLMFLLRAHLPGLGRRPLAVVEHTLQAMYQGGIFDHVGGGFSRYSTDEKWLIPHFEKMLYDNALLAMTYTEAFQITGEPLYRGVAEKIFGYIAREMTSPEGGFYSAQDADSEGHEGKYYVFTPEEIARVLGEEDGRVFNARYDITAAGNFEGQSIPNLISGQAALPDATAEAMLAKLYDYRLKRFALHKDDKSLTSWNALMIAAYAKAYRAFGEQAYLRAAEAAMAFIGRHLTAADGSLLVSYREGRSKGSGLLDDYAFLAWASLELYDSTFQPTWLARAAQLLDKALTEFADTAGGLYLSPRSGERLLFRPKEFHDGAMPSGNSVAAWSLVRLAALTGEEKWRAAAERQLSAYGPWFEKRPEAVTFALSALMGIVFPTQELVCALADEADKADLALKLGAFFLPQTSILAKAAPDEAALASLTPYAAAYPLPEKGVAYYLCQNHSCEAPTGDFEAIRPKLFGSGTRA